MCGKFSNIPAEHILFPEIIREALYQAMLSGNAIIAIKFLYPVNEVVFLLVVAILDLLQGSLGLDEELYR